MDGKRLKKTKKEPMSLNLRLLIFMILCWGVPIAVFFSFTISSYRSGIMMKAENLVEEQLRNTASIMSIRIAEAISLCQKPSYEKVWEDDWNDYRQERISRTEMLRNINSSLRGIFYLDERFDLYAFYLYGSGRPDCYGSRIGKPYNLYVEETQENIRDIASLDSSYAYVRIFDESIYIIRNLYTTSGYERYGTLVVALDRDKIFQEIDEDFRKNMEICIADCESPLQISDDADMDQRQRELFLQLRRMYSGRNNGSLERAENADYVGYLYEKTYDHYHAGVLVAMSKREMYESLYGVYRIVALTLLLFLPILLYGIYFLHNQIQKPIRKLVDASRKMADGGIGYQIGNVKMPNREFASLTEYFNRMSAQVKNLFDTVYNEKLERKDAQILALQAQINPHFLNNTLEMMNWQARMSGDTTVSKMIEALGTVLDYRINRANVREIHLSEELRCTDAYFYIMSMRFGRRLQIEREIDGELAQIMVPPLILQPIVENAIIHGVESVKNGTIELKVFHDEETVYLRVINSGKPISNERLQQIQAILAGDDSQIPEHQGHHTSIGIRNVNQRIKLVYGEAYGLTIERGEDGRTISTITVPLSGRETTKWNK